MTFLRCQDTPTVMNRAFNLWNKTNPFSVRLCGIANFITATGKERLRGRGRGRNLAYNLRHTGIQYVLLSKDYTILLITVDVWCSSSLGFASIQWGWLNSLGLFAGKQGCINRCRLGNVSDFATGESIHLGMWYCPLHPSLPPLCGHHVLRVG